MQTFLDDVAKIINASHDELNRVKIIVPSIRSITFLKESLKKHRVMPFLKYFIFILAIGLFCIFYEGLQSSWNDIDKQIKPIL